MTRNAEETERNKEAERWETVIKSWNSGTAHGLDYFQLREKKEYDEYMRYKNRKKSKYQ